MKQAFQKSGWHVIRFLLMFLSLTVALNACMALWDIYGLEWYAVHFENNAAARYYTSNSVLIMMCVLCFPWIRYIGTGAGLWDVGLMTVKLWTQPFTKNTAMETMGQWPTYSDASGILIFSTLLILLALFWPPIVFRVIAFFRRKRRSAVVAP